MPKVSLRELAPSRSFRYVEVGSVIACSMCLAGLGWNIARGFAAETPSWPSLFIATFAAFVCADLLAGIVHFLGDRFGSVDTPLLGLSFVLPFRAHHVHPQDMVRHDFVTTNGNNGFAVLFVVVPVALWMPVEAGGLMTSLGTFVWVLCALLLLTNQFHKWAHIASPPRLVRVLQRAGVLLSSERHRAHHQPPYEGGYCVTSGFCNRSLDSIGFFAVLERVIRGCLGLLRVRVGSR